MEYNTRFIRPDDAQRVLDIYAPSMEHTNISFEYEVPTPAAFMQRIETITAEYPWLVCEHNGEIVGYAYAGQHRARTAYKWSVESAIYMAEDFCGKGAGKLLYNMLFDLLRQQGFVNVFAGMTLPNAKSEGLHRSCGFRDIGVFEKIGYKNNQWHDVRWMQLDLQEHGKDMRLPVHIHEVMKNA